MNKIIFVFLVFFISEAYSQKINVNWIQEFESNKDIQDIPLVENEYVYIHLRNGNNNFIQKRSIANNEVKEIEIDLIASDGSKLNYFENGTGIYSVGSELYIVANVVSKKNAYIYLYKLNKIEMKFEVKQTILSTPIKNEKISVFSYVTRINDKDILIVNFSKSKGNSLYRDTYDEHNYTFSNDSFVELNFKEYLSVEIKDKISTKSESSITSDNIKFNYEGVDYLESAMYYNFENDLGVNYYSLVREQNKVKGEYKIFLMNYSSNFHEELRLVEMKEYYDVIKNRKILNCKKYNQFNFTATELDYVGAFKMNTDNYFYKLDRSFILSADEKLKFYFFSDIEIAKLSNTGEFVWYKRIDREDYFYDDSPDEPVESFYEFNFKNNLILVYYNKYLIIEMDEGSSKIESNPYFNLLDNTKIKILPNKESAIIFNPKKKNKRIGIVSFVE